MGPNPYLVMNGKYSVLFELKFTIYCYFNYSYYTKLIIFY